MANTVKLKRSAVADKIPTTSDLELGELAMNTNDGKLFMKKDDGTPAIVEIGAGGSQWDDVTNGVNYAGGNVGIGTTSPDARLHVANDQGGATGRVLIDANVTSGYDTSIDATDVGLEFTAESNSRGFAFNTGASPTEKVRITTDGKVGIGTTSPSVSLEIDGTDAVKVPAGTTAQRPASPVNGQQRYNSTLGAMETYVQGAWQVIANTSIDYGLITSSSTTTFDYGALS